jgi:hypothetical protein
LVGKECLPFGTVYLKSSSSRLLRLSYRQCTNYKQVSTRLGRRGTSWARTPLLQRSPGI